MFDVKKEILETHEARLVVEIEDKAVQDAMRQAARAISREVRIPGFRKGRAPYNKVVRYVGENAVRQEAADQILQDIYPDILEKAEVSPYGSGELENLEMSPLTFQIRVALEPTVTLGDYMSLREPWTDPTISDEEMTTILEQIREEHAVLEPVDRPAEIGDEVHIDVMGTSDGDVVVDEDDIEVQLSETEPFLAPGFVEELVGMREGEEKSFTLAFPDDLTEASLRGADVDFEVKMAHIYTRELPELDDALASTVGSFETLDELKQDVQDRMMTYKGDQAQQAYQDKLVQALIEQAEIQYPPAMLEDTLDDMVQETDDRLQREHQISLEDALQLDGRTMAQYREELQETAEMRLKRTLVLSEFAKQENVEVSDDDIVKTYADLMASAGLQDQSDLEPLQLDSAIAQALRSSAFGRKVMERLEKIGRGEGDLPDEAEEEPASDEDLSDESPIEAEADDAQGGGIDEAEASTDETVETPEADEEQAPEDEETEDEPPEDDVPSDETELVDPEPDDGSGES